VSIWTLDQVRQVQRLYVDLWVSDELVATSEHVLPTARKQAIRGLIHAAHPLAVEIDPLDVAFTEEPDARRFAVRIRGYWQPSVRTVEMAGGASDGVLVDVQDVERPILVPVPTAHPLLDETFPSSPRLDALQYQLSGWSETDRVWIFSPAIP
jgi:hypothetical protein